MLSLLLAIVLVVSCLPINSLAAVDTSAYTEPTVVVESKAAAAGATVDVNLLVVNNPGIAGAKLTISYDENLTLLDAVSGDTFADLDYTRPGVYTSPCNFNWDSESAEVGEDGVLLTLTFQVSEDAAANEKLDVNVSYRYGHIYNAELESIAFDMVSGYVSVINYIPGDVNSDGEVSGKDVTLIRRYNAGGYDISINEAAADVNDDGDISGKDVTLVRRYNAGGYDVELLPSTPKCSHNMQATAANSATCTEDGNCAYWYCSICKKYFADEAGVTEITLADTVLAATGHNVVVVPGYDATKTEPGLTDGKACNNPGCDYVEVEQEEIPVITGYQITYEIGNGDDYIESQNIIIDADKRQYFSDTGLELPQLKVAGYRFIGWSRSQVSTSNILTEIPLGATGDITLYGHWEAITYTVTFDTPDVSVNGTKMSGETLLNGTEYTVDKGKDLPVPKCFGYTFVGWSTDDGFLVSRIKPGTTGHMTLHANWTSDRNKATSYQSYGEPIIIEDDVNEQLLFVYNIGKIDNVPLNEVEFIGKTETLAYKKEVSVTDTVDEKFVENINKMISEATVKSSGWTLSSEWEDIYATQEEVGQLSEKSDERTTSEGKTVGGKYFVSNSEGGSTHVSTESGGSYSNSSKVTTENSMGINASYDTSTEKYCDAKLGASNTTEVSAGVEVPVKVAKVSAGVKNTTTVEAEVTNGRKDTSAFHIDGSLSSYVGTVDTSDSSAYYNSSVSNSSTWNSTTGYEQSYDSSIEESVTNAIKEQLSQTTTHSLSKALGGQDSTTESKEEQQMSSEEYATSFTYAKGTQETTTKTLEFNSSESGYYRIITAGTVHVYGVVGYDIATASYYTYCFNVLDDTTREILDYSKDNMNFNDCENGVVTFEVPYEINEYVAGFVGKTDGLEISYEGVVTGFTPGESFDGTVVVPQYEAKNNQDGTFSAVKVTSFAASAFAGKESIKTVVLPVYITEIPDGAFAGCTNLETVIAYGVTKIGANAFSGCTSLKKFSVDNAITSLGENAFKDVPEVAITAYDSKVADAAINCGAKNISLNIAYINDSFDNKVVEINGDVEYFALIGNGGTYNNVQIESDANTTMISNMIFANNEDTPIKLGSENVTLARVTIDDSPAFALVLTADQVELNLLGTISLDASVENTVLSKNVTINMADQSTTSNMVLNGKYLVCGEVTNKNYLNVEPTAITEEEFENYLISSIVTFDANGGSVEQTSKIVYMGQQYGVLPTPEKQYFDFKGWYTAAEGGTLITADTEVETKVNQTLYAQWEAITATLLFDANGGIVSESSRLVYLGEPISELPTPSRDYYRFDGWFTENGTQMLDGAVISEAGEITLYAHWTHNDASDWVLASEVPADAEIVNEKWTYTLREYTSDSNSTLSGWTKYDTQRTSWGAWSSWSTTNPTNGVRNVESRSVYDHTEYHYYRWTNGYGTYTYQYNSSYWLEEKWFTYILPTSSYGSSLGYVGSDKAVNLWARADYSGNYSVDKTFTKTVNRTEWRYQEPVYTYYYYRDLELETTAADPTGQTDVSNVVKWVQYRAK